MAAGIWALPVWGGGLNPCPDGLWQLFWEEFPSFWGGLDPCPDGLGHFFRDEVPQSARLSAGEGVQSLNGQCPNAFYAIFGGASLTHLSIHPSTCFHLCLKGPARVKDLGRGCYNRRFQNPGIAKIGLTPPPHTPILAHWWISRQKVRKCDSRQWIKCA